MKNIKFYLGIGIVAVAVVTCLDASANTLRIKTQFPKAMAHKLGSTQLSIQVVREDQLGQLHYGKVRHWAPNIGHDQHTVRVHQMSTDRSVGLVVSQVGKIHVPSHYGQQGCSLRTTKEHPNDTLILRGIMKDNHGQLICEKK